MTSLFECKNHRYKRMYVAEASQPTNSQLVSRLVCVICGHDSIDWVFRCVECGKKLAQHEADGIENKCSKHRTMAQKPVDTY